MGGSGTLVDGVRRWFQRRANHNNHNHNNDINDNSNKITLYFRLLGITGNNLKLILGLKRQLVASFEMIDLGIMHYYLGLQVFPLFDGIFIS